jgi:hypothetical protein
MSNASKRTFGWLAAGLVLLTGIGITSNLTVLAQERRQASVLETQLGVNAGDLTARLDLSGLPSRPVEINRDRNNSANSTTKPDIHGETSVENFQGTQNNLSWTHDSAAGFRSWLEQWYATNYHRQDTGVSSWLFHDYNAANRNFDLWNSGGIDYGIDAVLIAWHSSHGGMNNNVFSTSLGANWDSTGWSAQSNLMAMGGNWSSFADERLRYIFWDTCQSVMIDGGSNPYSTWATRSKGMRFVFGYASNSVDSPNYGSFFGQEWAKGKTLKYSFLDASWRISTSQRPSLVAFGATQAEAISRRDTETYFSWSWASNAWAAWSWYNVASVYAPSLAPEFFQSRQAATVGVNARSNSNAEVGEIARAFGIVLPNESAIIARPSDIKMVRTNAVNLTVEKNGNFELNFNAKEEENESAPVLSDASLISRAQSMAAQLSFIDGQSLRVGMVRELNENAGTAGAIGQARVTEKTVIFDQTINGTPFVDAEAGHLEITFGARSGQIRRVRNTVQAIRAATTAAQSALMSQDEARQRAIADFSAAAGVNASAAEIVAGSEQVGYVMMEGRAVLVYRALLKTRGIDGSRQFQAVVPLGR